MKVAIKFLFQFLGFIILLVLSSLVAWVGNEFFGWHLTLLGVYVFSVMGVIGVTLNLIITSRDGEFIYSNLWGMVCLIGVTFIIWKIIFPY